MAAVVGGGGGVKKAMLTSFEWKNAPEEKHAKILSLGRVQIHHIMC